MIRKKQSRKDSWKMGLMNYLKEEREGTWQKDTELNVNYTFSIRRIIA